MRFEKSSKLDNVLYDVRGPVVDEANRMEEMGTHILKLNIGNPAPFGFRTPDEVVYDMARQLPECEGYSNSKGLYSARKAIMQYAQNKHIPNVGIEDIYTGNGVSELINLCMQALLNDGDEILIPSPDYPLWTACATLSGGKPVHYICDEESDWFPDMDDIRSKITCKTKAIVIINPNNPTGAVYSRQVLLDILDVARRHNLLVCSDEIYDRLVMDDLVHDSCAALAPDVPVLTFNGLSKSHIICGFRCGWVTLSGPKGSLDQVRSGLVQLASLRLCGNALTQLVIPAALSDTESTRAMLVPGGRLYEQRRAAMEILQHSDAVSCVPNSAAFYVFPKIDARRFHIEDDREFALGLLRSKHILIVPGSGFDYPEPDHLRIVMLPRPDELKAAMQQLHEYLLSRE